MNGTISTWNSKTGDGGLGGGIGDPGEQADALDIGSMSGYAWTG